ncbi:hypothetical protein K1719_004271 [Acacia pycnantha]|nr:hypothetical protein K1719_004271 [Acacia pycnantha]
MEVTEEEKTKIISNNVDLDLNRNPMNPPSPTFENQGSFISSNNKNEPEENMIGDVLYLIMMACKRCRLYVMVLKFDQECPNCKSTNLLDVVGYFNNNNLSRETNLAS